MVTKSSYSSVFRLAPPKPDQQSVPPVTEREEDERSEGVASINYIVLDLDPTSTSEASAVTPTSKTGDSVPNSAGKDAITSPINTEGWSFQVVLLELGDT